MNIDLEPCPFCGGNATLFVNDGVRVCCTKCGNSTGIFTDDYNLFQKGKGTAIEIVVKKWNKRVTEVENDGE